MEPADWLQCVLKLSRQGKAPSCGFTFETHHEYGAAFSHVSFILFIRGISE